MESPFFVILSLEPRLAFVVPLSPAQGELLFLDEK